MQIVYSPKLIYIYLKKLQNIYSQLQRATETNVNLLLEKMLMVKVRLFNYRNILLLQVFIMSRGRHGRDHIVVGLATTYAISAYHHYRCEFEPHSGEVYSIQHYAIEHFVFVPKVNS
jgi:hypothetical protein